MAGKKKMRRLDNELICLGTWNVDNIHMRHMMVDVFLDKSEDVLEAWIYDSRYGMKSHMFGVSASQFPLDDFLDLVEGNIASYIITYWKEIDKIENEDD